MDLLYRLWSARTIRIPWILNRFLSVEYTTEKLYKILIEMPHLWKVVISTLTFCKSSKMENGVGVITPKAKTKQILNALEKTLHKHIAVTRNMT
jgi:hypothetical protein